MDKIISYVFRYPVLLIVAIGVFLSCLGVLFYSIFFIPQENLESTAVTKKQIEEWDIVDYRILDNHVVDGDEDVSTWLSDLEEGIYTYQEKKDVTLIAFHLKNKDKWILHEIKEFEGRIMIILEKLDLDVPKVEGEEKTMVVSIPKTENEVIVRQLVEE